MKRLHGMTLRMLPGPFLGWLGTLMFLLLMQFLIEKLPDLAGKGLSFWLIAEVVSYSLAYMMVLAVPMSVLLATLMAFGQFASSKGYAAAKSAGVSLWQIAWPALVVGLLVSGAMVYFNNVVLPEANFRAKNLWRDIRVKKPGFALRPGVFYDALDEQALLVREIPPDSSGVLRGVTVFDYTGGIREQTTIQARRGRLRSEAGGTRIHLTLYDGEIHRSNGRRSVSRYERLRFDTHALTLELPGSNFERGALREDYRSDRSTPTLRMIQHVDSLRTVLAEERRQVRRLNRVLWDGAPAADSSIRAAPQAASPQGDSPPGDDGSPAASGASVSVPVRRAAAPAAPPPEGAASDTARSSTADRYAVSGLARQDARDVYRRALETARAARSDLSDRERSLVWTARKTDSYQVEIYKKSSMAVACFLFVLIGIPLGLSMQRGSLGVAGGIALAIFLFYWVTLVLGEKAADRDVLEPWVGMWAANAVMLVIGSWLMLYVALDLRATPPLRRRLWEWMRGAAEARS